MSASDPDHLLEYHFKTVTSPNINHSLDHDPLRKTGGTTVDVVVLVFKL